MLRKSRPQPSRSVETTMRSARAPSRTHHAVGRWSPRGLPDLVHLSSRTCTCMPLLRRVPTATAAQVSTRWFSVAPKPDPDRSRGAPCRRWTQRCSQAIRLRLENQVDRVFNHRILKPQHDRLRTALCPPSARRASRTVRIRSAGVPSCSPLAVNRWPCTPVWTR